MNLFQETKYLADIDYLLSTYIREYDISKANINVFYKYGVIDKTQYEQYLRMTREARQISIGLMLRDRPELNQVLKEGITEAKRMFFEANNIQEQDILSIKNDAIFIINKIPTYTKFGNIEFIMKNVYTSYYNLDGIELYYFFDIVTGQEKMDVKGIDDSKLMLHKNYFMEFLAVCFNSAQTYSIQDTIDIVTNFYIKYIGLELEPGYYREFNTFSMYRLRSYSSNSLEATALEEIGENQLQYIDIVWNLNLIRKLHQIYSGIYFSRM